MSKSNLKLKDFLHSLEKFRKPESNDPYDNRVTHCRLSHMHRGKEHIFDVRGWRKNPDDTIYLSVVNWTLCAGTASLTINAQNVDLFKIKDSNYY